MPTKVRGRGKTTVRGRRRADGPRTVVHWVPDLRDPRVRADIRRQGALLAKHPENAAIDAWLEAARDTSDES